MDGDMYGIMSVIFIMKYLLYLPVYLLVRT